MADLLEVMNAQREGWNVTMGLRFTTATPELVVGRLTVAAQHLQPFGIVHGGVHCGVIEAACSVGAAVAAASRGHVGGVVGLENSTSFIRAVRLGAELEARATPLTRGKTTHVWQCEIREVVGDAPGPIVATGRVRLLCIAKDQV